MRAIAQQFHSRQSWRGVAADRQNLAVRLPDEMRGYVPELPWEILVDKQHLHVLPLVVPDRASAFVEAFVDVLLQRAEEILDYLAFIRFHFRSNHHAWR
ncbi:hypothetical protein D3C85_1137160 [compost metagenome]